MLENAFDLSPTVPNAGAVRLPRAFVPGTNSPAAMGYKVLLAQLGEFRLILEISGDLQTWFDADTHPTYFLIHTVTVGNEMQYFVERGAGWPGGAAQIFLRLRIERV